jgi:hypothetical protein
MAAHKNELTITLSESDGRLSVESLTLALKDALEMLKNVSDDIVSPGTVVRWEIVRARMSSPLSLTLAPRIPGRTGPRFRRQVVLACLAGVKEIEHEATAPPHFNDDALTATKRLAKAAQRDGASLTFSANGSAKVTLTKKTVDHIEQIEAKARLYVDFSTIEGYLEVLSVRHRMSFYIWESHTDKKVECLVTDTLFDKALSLIKGRPRLAVTGRVHYRNHIPKTIDVDSIRVFPDISELPQPESIGPIDITDGLSSEDHVRRMRNG